VSEPWAFSIAARGVPIPFGNRIELFIGTFVGAITFSGSVIAFGKLAGNYKFRLFQGAPVVFPGQHLFNLVLAILMVGAGLIFVVDPGVEAAWTPFIVMTVIAFILGVLIIIPIGGADMPVVVSMLNSYSGWAAAGIGFSLNNSMLIIAGSLVGSSGAILSYIMCAAMNRSFISVILGGFGGEAGDVVAGAQQQRNVRSGSADDAAFVMSNAETVIIVPGYGLAVARAQHAVQQITDTLRQRGVQVRFDIHPVAGRLGLELLHGASVVVLLHIGTAVVGPLQNHGFAAKLRERASLSTCVRRLEGRRRLPKQGGSGRRPGHGDCKGQRQKGFPVNHEYGSCHQV
jgi:NAD(P) transhydrogenase subunit beta